MAEKSSFFTSLNGDRKYKSSDFAEYFSTFIGNGVFPNPSNNLLVTSNGDMTINLSAGFAWINGYMYHNTDNLTLTVEHADSALKRIDRVVLRCDFINREIKAYVKKGKFATSPTSPALERSVNAYELSVADILVENGVISIQQSKITDTRLDESVCGIVTQTVKEIETSELYRKLQGYIDERGQDVQYWIETATTQWGIDFNTWFQTIKDILSGDVAGALADRILELENKVNNLDLVASKVTMSNGSTVEDNINSLKNELGTNKATLQNNINSIREVL
nr:MAG TPA: Receptor Binding Protein [Caudoviricetes sp.]